MLTLSFLEEGDMLEKVSAGPSECTRKWPPSGTVRCGKGSTLITVGCVADCLDLPSFFSTGSQHIEDSAEPIQRLEVANTGRI